METLTATFRIVTPMFLSGADPSEAELRLPSIKGALRFWWRALAWARHGDELAQLRQAESALFGGVEEGAGQAACLLKLADQAISTAEQGKWRPHQWEAYVGYGLTETAGGGSRAYIEPGSSFALQLISRERLAADGQDDPHAAVRALGLLGGLGGRSRKGWGSLSLTEIRGDRDGLAWAPPPDLDGLERQVRSLIPADGANGEAGLPEYTAFSSRTRVEFGPLQRNAAEAHRYLAQLYKATVKTVPEKAEREQFGLPRKGKNHRRASPLFLHVHELPDGRGVPVALFMPARFLTDRQEPDGAWRHVERFLANVANGEVQ